MLGFHKLLQPLPCQIIPFHLSILTILSYALTNYFPFSEEILLAREHPVEVCGVAIAAGFILLPGQDSITIDKLPFILECHFLT